MSKKGAGAKNRRIFRVIQWRIMLWQIPLVLFLLAGILYWLEGRLEEALRATSLRLSQNSALLATSAVRSSMASESTHSKWDRIGEVLPKDQETRIEIVSLEGAVLHSSDPAMRGMALNRFVDAPCLYCHVAGSPRPSAETKLISEPGEKPYLAFATILPNSPDCRPCHGDAGPKLGMVYIRQPLEPIHQLIRAARISFLIGAFAILGLTVLTTRSLLGRYLDRPRLSPAAHTRSVGTGLPHAHDHPPGKAPPAAAAETADESAERLRESMEEVARQREELSTIYYIADQLSLSIQPNMVCRRAVELSSSIFGSVCVLIAGHFHPDSRAFHGTVTYYEPGGDIVERPYPDDGVKRAVPFYNGAIVERWLRGELDGVIRFREEPTVAYPLERHGRRLGLLLAPTLGRHESLVGRPAAAHPQVVQAARQHLAIALELSELQRERLQQERLAAIGQTVAGLSHCMKNALNGLKGGQYVIERAVKIQDPEKLRKGLMVLTNGVRHLERLTYDMLSYAGERSLDRKPANPNDIMREVIDLLEESARNNGVSLRADFDERMAPIPLDRHALYRAIMNLVTNAIDACIESETGSTVVLRSRLRPDDVLLTVEDNGVGIPKASLRRVTERFFTTKGSKGTGLGLPVVMKIAEQHGGALEVESTFGHGSAFHLRIPTSG